MSELVEYANSAIILLGDIRRDSDRLAEARSHMVGGGGENEWFFASPRDEADAYAIERRMPAKLADLARYLVVLGKWGAERGYTTKMIDEMIASHRGGFKVDDDMCATCEGEVRALLHGLAVEQAMAGITGLADSARRPTISIDDIALGDQEIILAIGRFRGIDLARQADIIEQVRNVGQRQVKERLPELEAKQLVERPNGRNGGYRLTKSGRDVFEVITG